MRAWAPRYIADMKVATFNVNNIARRLPNLLAWLKTAKPDVVCWQELKAEDSAFPAQALEKAGYGAVWCGQRTYNGVAILARGKTPVVTRRALPGDATDVQARYIEAAIDGTLFASIYLPNGNPQPGPKFDYKLAWFKRLIAHARALKKANIPVILAGDFNVVPTDLDIYPSKSWDDDALLQPESRAAFKNLIGQGWIDCVRMLHPDAPMYSFWDYMRNRWPRDAGLRIDAILISPDLGPLLTAAGVDRAVRGKPGASDHAPVWANLKDYARPGSRNSGQISRATRRARVKSSSKTIKRRGKAAP